MASLALGFYTSWSLSLVTLAGIPIFTSIIGFISSRMKASIIAQQVELTGASKVASNAITNIETVKCLNGQAFEHRTFCERIEQSATHYLRQARLNSLQIAFIRWMIFGMFVQGFWYGSSLARTGKLSSGEVLRTFWACLTAAQSLEQILPQMIVMEKGKVASVALKLIVRSPATTRSGNASSGTRYPEHCEGDIEVKDVSSELALHQHQLIGNLGVFRVPKPARSNCPQSLYLLLPSRRNYLRYREKWIWKEYSQSAIDAVLLANIW
jgi:ATP-binding cassette subfamily B (MDR/TAP) protein 1